MRHSIIVVGLAWFVVLGVIGCGGGDDGRVNVYPVTGKVVVRGQPAEGATITFYPTAPELKEANVPPPTGTVDARGEYQLSTYEPDDGAPEGQFNVTLVWPEPTPPNVDPEMYEPKDRLGGRYRDPQTSGLKATVEPGGGELPPFELK